MLVIYLTQIEMNRNLIKKITIGDQIQALVIDKDAKTKIINFSLKQSLITSASEEKLPVSFEQSCWSWPETAMFGYIKSISQRGIFVGFNGKFVGLVLPSYTGLSREEDISNEVLCWISVKVYLLRRPIQNNKEFLLSFHPQIWIKNHQKHHRRLLIPVDESV